MNPTQIAKKTPSPSSSSSSFFFSSSYSTSTRYLIVFAVMTGFTTLLYRFSSLENVLNSYRTPEEEEEDWIRNAFSSSSFPADLKLKFTRENETFRRKLRTLVERRSDPSYMVVDDPKIQPPSARIRARRIFLDRPFVIWTSDLHMSPTKDLEETLTPFGVKFLHHNFDHSRCQWHACGSPLKLKVLNAEYAKYMPMSVREDFYKAYRNDSDMRSVDAFYCAHPASLCEIYLPFDKCMLVLPSARYDMFRHTVDRWSATNRIFAEMARRSWNVFGGNNLYDAEFLRYYTGIETQHVPSMCDYTSARYTGESRKFLLLRRYDTTGFDKVFFRNFSAECDRINCTVKMDVIGRFTYDLLGKYRAVVNVPYQVSVMSAFELYRMNVPMFSPSPELLARWQVDHYLMVGRTNDGSALGVRPNASKIPAHPSRRGVPDPKNEFDYEAVLYWVRMCDYYQVMPYGIVYDSVEHLVGLLQSVDDSLLARLSEKMERYNVGLKKDLLDKWRDVLLRCARNGRNRPT